MFGIQYLGSLAGVIGSERREFEAPLVIISFKVGLCRTISEEATHVKEREIETCQH